HRPDGLVTRCSRVRYARVKFHRVGRGADMNGLIRASLANPRAVTVSVRAILFVGYFSIASIPIDILPIFKSPAVQVLTFYSGMPASSIEKAINNQME